MNEAIRVKECMLSQNLSQGRQKPTGPAFNKFFSFFYLSKWRYIKVVLIRISILGVKNINP